MDTKLTIKDVRHHSWAVMLQNQAESGLSVRQWCEENHVSRKSFYYRRKQLFAELSGQNTPFVEIKPWEHIGTGPASGQFVPRLTVRLGSALIGVNEPTTEDLLAMVCRVVFHA